MYFKFEEIIVWQKAMDLGEKLNSLTEDFPLKERFNLTSQLCRAVDSIALNIAEGSISQSNPEFRRFVGYAIRSLAETVTCVIKARNRNYIEIETFDQLYKESFNLMNMIVAFKHKIN